MEFFENDVDQCFVKSLSHSLRANLSPRLGNYWIDIFYNPVFFLETGKEKSSLVYVGFIFICNSFNVSEFSIPSSWIIFRQLFYYILTFKKGKCDVNIASVKYTYSFIIPHDGEINTVRLSHLKLQSY